MKLCINHAAILTPSDLIKDGAVLLQDGYIEWVGKSSELKLPSGCLTYQVPGQLLTPGWFDLQINGGFGFDFASQPESIWSVAQQLPRFGVTTFLPTIITSPADIIRRAQRTLGNPPLGFTGAAPLGLHVEGPFINAQRKGAHNATHIRLPNDDFSHRWSADEGIRMVTLAPELPNALEVTRTLTGHGVVVSAGHSLASWEEAQRGFEAGIHSGTHLFNAMPPIDHRKPGLVAALIMNNDISFGVIVDGIHVHREIVAFLWRFAGPQRMYLVTDAMAALGMPPGEYSLGEMKVFADHVSARLRDGSLAGSVLSMDQAIRNLVHFTGCSLQDAICSVTDTPARLLGENEKRGRIAPGWRGDLVLLTPTLQVSMTFVAGDLVFDRNNESTKPRID